MDWYGPSIWWADNQRTLAYGITGSARASGFGVWVLNLTRPGHDLVADSRLAWSIPVPNTYDPNQKRPLGCSGSSPSVLVTGDGKSIVCGAWGVFGSTANLPNGICPAAPAWNDEGFLEYSTATGKLARTLYSSSTSCVPNSAPVQVLWASTSGDAVIGYFDFTDEFSNPGQSVTRFGVFREHTFKALPAPPSKDPGTVAWLAADGAASNLEAVQGSLKREHSRHAGACRREARRNGAIPGARAWPGPAGLHHGRRPVRAPPPRRRVSSASSSTPRPPASSPARSTGPTRIASPTSRARPLSCGPARRVTRASAFSPTAIRSPATD
jgi:hypothetical protein